MSLAFFQESSVVVSDMRVFLFFFFQAEDGIRDWSVTGVQTCALPISPRRARCTDRPNPHQSLDSPLDSPLGPTSGLWASSPFSFLKHPCRVTSNFGGWTFSFNLSLRESANDLPVSRCVGAS